MSRHCYKKNKTNNKILKNWSQSFKCSNVRNIFFVLYKKKKTIFKKNVKLKLCFCVEMLVGGTSGFVSLQNFFSSLKISVVLASFKEEYAEIGTSEEHRSNPGSLDEKWRIFQPHINTYINPFNRQSDQHSPTKFYVWFDIFEQLSGFLLNRVEGWVECKKLWDVVVGYISWDCCIVKEFQVGFVHQEHFTL